MDYSFIFPVHNESDFLIVQLTAFVKEVLAKLNQSPKFEIILVENGSTDLSWKIVSSLGKRFSFVKAIRLATPSYGNAIKQGILSSKGEKIFILNVDYFDSEFIVKAINLLDHLDIVIGSKTLSKSEDKRSYFRRLATYFFNVFLRLVLNYPGTDTHGIKAFKRSELLFKTISLCRTQNELFDTELVIRMTHKGAIFVDLPQTVVEVRPSRYFGLRRLRSTFSDLVLAVSAKYFGQKSTSSFTMTDADDYGISAKVNNAILEQVALGNVQIVSIMPNLVNQKYMKMLKVFSPQIHYSLHFNVLRGRPCSPRDKVKSLVNTRGEFNALPVFITKLVMGKIVMSEILTEFRAQYHAMLKHKILPTHLSSEQHIHVFPPINQVLSRAILNTSIVKVRSVSSTRNYLSKKRVRFAIFNFLYMLCGLKFGYHKKLTEYYHAQIVHPGTSYD